MVLIVCNFKGPFQIFSKIRGYIFAFKFTFRSQQPDIVPIICDRGVIDTGGKFATGINNNCKTGGKFAPVLLIPVVHLDLHISLRIFEQI